MPTTGLKKKEVVSLRSSKVKTSGGGEGPGEGVEAAAARLAALPCAGRRAGACKPGSAVVVAEG